MTVREDPADRADHRPSTPAVRGAPPPDRAHPLEQPTDERQYEVHPHQATEYALHHRRILQGVDGTVTAVSRSATHTFSKQTQDGISLLPGLGVDGDAHMGETVKHRSRVARDPTQPNLRQVHLIHAELHEELRYAGFEVGPGDMGENLTTRGIDLLGLPTGTRLHVGESAVVEITGLRNPCVQLDKFQPGLMSAVLGRDEHGRLIRKSGVMGVVTAGGQIRPGDPIHAELPPQPHRPLDKV